MSLVRCNAHQSCDYADECPDSQPHAEQEEPRGHFCTVASRCRNYPERLVWCAPVEETP